MTKNPNLADLARSLTEGIREGRYEPIDIKAIFEELTTDADSALARALPALIVRFDDVDGDPALTLSPGLTVRFGIETQTCKIIRLEDLEIPEVARALGKQACDAFSMISDVGFHARTLGFEGVTYIREAMSDRVSEILQKNF